MPPTFRNVEYLIKAELISDNCHDFRSLGR